MHHNLSVVEARSSSLGNVELFQAELEPGIPKKAPATLLEGVSSSV
jgi:hypothetical protein